MNNKESIFSLDDIKAVKIDVDLTKYNSMKVTDDLLLSLTFNNNETKDLIALTADEKNMLVFGLNQLINPNPYFEGAKLNDRCFKEFFTMEQVKEVYE